MSRQRKSRKNPGFPEVEGVFSAAAGGFGFVENENGFVVFIPAAKTGRALSGDLVKAAVTEQCGPGRPGPAGEIREILERRRQFVVGAVQDGRALRLLDEHFNLPVRISGSLRGVRCGDWVKLRLLNTGKKFTKRLTGVIAAHYGEAGSVAADLHATAAEFDLAAPYTEADNRAAAKLKAKPMAREDLRGLYTVTIDPEDAHDFDDAVSLSPGPGRGTVILGVHIADVAAWISAGSRFDKAAASRGFSAYLPGMFLPMLPPALTSLLSLRSGADSCAHSILFTVRKSTGEILKTRRTHSMVRVNATLDYDTVQKFIDSPRCAPKSWTPELKAAVKGLIALVRKMRRRRLDSERPLAIDAAEVRALCDPADLEITGLKKNLSREAEQLVEECMLAANTAAAEELITRRVAGVYRVHAPPSEARLDDFTCLMRREFRIDPGDLTDRANCERFLTSLPAGPRKDVIASHFLRSLPRAVYSAKPALHFGLGKTRYAHFTSPIRRYPDLLVHRQLQALDTNAKLLKQEFCREAARRCSEQEERTDKAYFAANDRLKLHYLHQHNDPDAPMPELYEAVIAKVVPGGLLCHIDEVGLYGFVPAEKLFRGGMRYHRSSRRLTTPYGHGQYKCGDILYVALDALDFVRGRAVFRPA